MTTTSRTPDEPQAAGAPVAPDRMGSVRGVPHLPAGFDEVFSSRYLDIGGLRLHAVTGGSGLPLLLLAGWPQTWFAWRLLMPALARDYQVVALDARGTGLSDSPGDGYDTGTLAADAVACMRALGHERFAVVGHDIGMWTGYAIAADHPGVLDRLAVAEAAIPGLSPAPPLFTSQPIVDRLWHFTFNRLGDLNERLVEGRERLFFGHQFATKAARPDAIPDWAVDVYVQPLAASADALRASFGPYRALDTTIEQNIRRRTRRLQLPVLTIAGGTSSGDAVNETMRLAADDVTGLVLPGVGHYPLEEAPDAVLSALRDFLAPYRAASVGSGDPAT